MIWSLLGWITLATTAATAPPPGPAQAPPSWSPDGRWVAYLSTGGDGGGLPAPGWIFGWNESAAPAEGESTTYRLWTTRPETGVSVLLDEGAGPRTAPGWSPDGLALAFGRVVNNADGSSTYEVVVQQAPDQQRVILRTPLPVTGSSVDGLVSQGVVWSPDGRLLAAPRVDPPGLLILKAEDGAEVRALDHASRPSWSSRSGRLAFVRMGPEPGVFAFRPGRDEPRRMAREVPPSGPLVWSADGQSLWTLGRSPDGTFSLVRLGPEGRKPEFVRSLADPGAPGGPPRSASFAIDRSGQDLYSSNEAEHQDTVIAHHRLREPVVMKRWNPIDSTVPVGALAVSPDGRTLALRAGASGTGTVPGLCRLEDQKLTPLVPDDATRARWLTLLIADTRELLKADATPMQVPATFNERPGPQPVALVAERPTLLPVSTEPHRLGDGEPRLRHLADLGRALCDRPSDAPAPSPRIVALLTEARLFFAGLRDDPTETLAALDAFESRPTSPDGRLRLLALRAQLGLARGDLESARAAVGYLRKVHPGSPGRLEQTPAGPVLTADPDPFTGWVDYLSFLIRGLPGSSPAPATPPDAEQPLPRPQAPRAGVREVVRRRAPIRPAQPRRLEPEPAQVPPVPFVVPE